MSPAPTAKVSKGKRPSGTRPGKSSSDSGEDDPFDYKPSPPGSVVTPEWLDSPAGVTHWSKAEDKGAKRKERIAKKSRKCGGLHKPKSTSNSEPAAEHEVEEEMHVYWAEDGTVQFWKG
jgi:hypothetical protein